MSGLWWFHSDCGQIVASIDNNNRVRVWENPQSSLPGRISCRQDFVLSDDDDLEVDVKCGSVALVGPVVGLGPRLGLLVLKLVGGGVVVLYLDHERKKQRFQCEEVACVGVGTTTGGKRGSFVVCGDTQGQLSCWFLFFDRPYMCKKVLEEIECLSLVPENNKVATFVRFVVVCGKGKIHVVEVKATTMDNLSTRQLPGNDRVSCLSSTSNGKTITAAALSENNSLSVFGFSMEPTDDNNNKESWSRNIRLSEPAQKLSIASYSGNSFLTAIHFKSNIIVEKHNIKSGSDSGSSNEILRVAMRESTLFDLALSNSANLWFVFGEVGWPTFQNVGVQDREEGDSVVVAAAQINKPGERKLPRNNLKNKRKTTNKEKDDFVVVHANGLPLVERVTRKKKKIEEISMKAYVRTPLKTGIEELESAIATSDMFLLDRIISKTASRDIGKIISDLPEDALVPFLEYLTRAIWKQPSRATTLIPWVSAILAGHSTYLILREDFSENTKRFHQYLESRVAKLDSLLALQGRLDLLLYHDKPEGSALENKEPQTEGVENGEFEDESSSDNNSNDSGSNNSNQSDSDDEDKIVVDEGFESNNDSYNDSESE